jgi:mRNA-binding protein PUF3
MIQDIRGHIVEFSGDQFGSRYIQQKLESCSADDRQRIFDEIMPSAYLLMSDVFGNYVVQKMFELGDAKQKALLAKKMESNVLYLSMHMYGCRVSLRYGRLIRRANLR